tara:strand:+ start:25 stop:378 length:354 start_codon:yes stop_codon:yes gene_type:complete
MNISKNKLKDIIQEELNVLLGLNAPYMGYDPGPETIDLPKNINDDLLLSAEKAANVSSNITNNLNKLVLMLECVERGEDLTNVQAQVMNTLDNITDVVNELNVFHENKNNQKEIEDE